MNNYFVGSVADLISQNEGFKSKSKKNKKILIKKIDEDVTTEVIHPVYNDLPIKKNKIITTLPNEFDTKIKKRKKSIEKNVNVKELSHKRKKQSSEVPDLVYSDENTEVVHSANNESSSKKSKRKNSVPDKHELKTKKRKKSNVEEDSENIEDVSYQSKQDISEIPELDQVPSDSEEENELDSSRKQNKKNFQNFELKDFTENTVFVGNVPISYDKKKVCKMFSKYGKIQSARIRCVPIGDINISKKVAAIKKNFNPNRDSLVAYVKFETKDSANAALKANGLVIDGHHLRVDLAEQKQERENNKAVFVGGLPFNIKEDELWEFFQKCGTINSVRIIRDSQTSMGKGFGYVNFESSASVELALQLNGETLKKRAINVQRCVKSRNKNKLNAFGKKKSKEMIDQLLSKKVKKLKADKSKVKMERKPISNEFRGREANMKQKKKKKPSKTALRKKKIIKILGVS